MTLWLIILTCAYLIGVAFMSALWSTASGRAYWTRREAFIRWLDGAVLWPVQLARVVLWLLWAVPAGYVLQGIEYLRERRR